VSRQPRIIVATARIADAEATAERERRLAAKEDYSKGRYERGILSSTYGR